MSGRDGTKLTTSDQELIEQTRSGDQRAFGELWRRHYRSGARVARQFTSTIDADDLVSEAYTRIYQRVLAGGGPTGAFRPYLYTTIRNLASTWGAASKEVQVDDLADFEDPQTLDDPAAIALDRTLTARAFRSLPDRWQSVLWYTEVEGMDPHEVAPLLGMSANGVAALSYRAREGLRKAWLQAHISDASAAGECQWTMSHMGEHARRKLSARDSERMAFHLTVCPKCAIVSEELDEVGSRLALVMLPIVLGGVAGGALLTSLGGASAAVSSTAAAIPAAPVLGGAVASAGAVGAVGVAAPVALVGTLAVAVAISGAAVISSGEPAAAPSPYTTSETQPELPAPTAEPTAEERALPAPTPVPAADDPTNLGGVLGETVEGVGGAVGGVVGGVVDGVVEPVLDAVLPTITLSGSGVPGATVTAEAGGVVYATTSVGSDGRFSLAVSGLPQAAESVQLSQTIGGALGFLGLNIPLRLDTGPLGIVVNLLN